MKYPARRPDGPGIQEDSELVWQLSALHLHRLTAYDPEQNGSAPLGWHRDFSDARLRLRDWVAASGTRLDWDRSTRQTTWPGEEPAAAVEGTLDACDAAPVTVRTPADTVVPKAGDSHEFLLSR